MGKVHDISTSCTSVVDEDESLSGVNCCGTERTSFPSRLFDEPSGRYFDTSVGKIVGRHRREIFCYSLSDGSVDLGVLEEAACVTLYLRIWQFARTDVENRSSDISKRGTAKSFDIFADRTVVEIEWSFVLEVEIDSCDDYLVFEFVFENTIPVAEMAVGGRDGERFSCAEAESVDHRDSLSGFHTIGANILDG